MTLHVPVAGRQVRLPALHSRQARPQPRGVIDIVVGGSSVMKEGHAANARDMLKVVGMARDAGLAGLADLIDRESRHPDRRYKPMDPDSASLLVSFLTRHRREMPMPDEIRVGVGGRIIGGWAPTGSKSVSISITSPESVRLVVGTLKEKGSGLSSIHVSERATYDEVLKEVASMMADRRLDPEASDAGAKPHAGDAPRPAGGRWHHMAHGRAGSRGPDAPRSLQGRPGQSTPKRARKLRRRRRDP